MSALKAIFESIQSGEGSVPVSDANVNVYPKSYTVSGSTQLVMVKEGYEKFILALGDGVVFNELQGMIEDGVKRCPLTHENRLALNRHLEYTVPRAFGTQVATFGLGDRLGIASPGHLQTVAGREVYPILAQQSIRELNLTGRNYKQVVDAACFAVFQEGYKNGFGADGDHLKVEADIQMALDLGFTMLTLDCSEKIDNTLIGSTAEQRAQKYDALPEATRRHYESRYLNQTFQVGETSITFDQETLIENVLVYGAAIDFMEHVYRTYIVTAPRTIDFEISIDETLTPTAPESHFFVAQELYKREVEIFSMAPRFCGEFQKGIDYIGDIAQFEKEMIIHAGIADHFGYKLSIHSGSDKFSVFPIIAKYTRGRFHVKTAGTNWLEAVRTLAKVNPSLYRRMHQYALDHFVEATAYYHVKADLSLIKPLDSVADQDLPEYMNEENARQMIHITYGILLQAKDGDGQALFKDAFFRTLSEQEDAYAASLISHIGKHLDLLVSPTF
ncbi:tagaturonate epimerase family protein [Paenibacillus koleovorans]|uniref:tagaturonate epimerase family protein n=1 Tax=Paenibacillus koleovorans TaxID=121608 RepID=UPI000FD891C9|nr:tagaturonate epimerase family protein [Paenibacillus koleovorans]